MLPHHQRASQARPRLQEAAQYNNRRPTPVQLLCVLPLSFPLNKFAVLNPATQVT